MGNWQFILLHISTALILGLFILILRMKNKKSLHYISLALAGDVLVWSLSLLIDMYAQLFFTYEGMFFIYLCFTAVGFVSVFIFFTGLAFASDSQIKRPYYLLFVLPVLNMIFIWTSEANNLFFDDLTRDGINIIMKQGPMFYFQMVYAYAMIVLGLSYLIYFSIKNAGFFSKQSLLILTGALIPVIVDVLLITKLAPITIYLEPASFAFGVLFFMLAIFRFGFLNIVPIALQTVVDHISDSYIVLNVNNEVIDFNKTLTDIFTGNAKIKRKTDINEWLEKIYALSGDSPEEFSDSLRDAIENKKSVFFDKQLMWEDFDKTFTVEISPIYSDYKHKGTIILLKDITEQKKSFDMVRRTQTRLIETEHLASLGQLVGGIAHNLKTPIMSISGGLEGLSDLINEYDASIDNPGVTSDDHHDIANDMRQWIVKMKSYCSYMSDIISTVKGQAVQLTANTTDKFILKELLKRIDILMKHELKRYCCELRVDCRVDENIEIYGEVNSLVQVFNNLIINSIESYEGKEGQIDFTITMDSDLIKFEIRDYGCGMPEDVKKRLFKEMITTKAKHGTGLGLYMSYSTIWGRFGGKMWFVSEEGKGTVFFVSIPAVNSQSGREET